MKVRLVTDIFIGGIPLKGGEVYEATQLNGRIFSAIIVVEGVEIKLMDIEYDVVED